MKQKSGVLQTASNTVNLRPHIKMRLKRALVKKKNGSAINTAEPFFYMFKDESSFNYNTVTSSIKNQQGRPTP